MNRTFQRTLVAMALLFVTCVVAQADEKDEEGFVSIFNGKTLKGWEAMPARSSGAWTVKDGVLIGDGDKCRRGKSYLTYENTAIADLELKLSYRFPGKGNSGVSLRARKDETRKRAFQSYHADLGHVGIGEDVLGAWDFHTPGRIEHGCPRGERLVIDENDGAARTKLEDAVTLEGIHQGEWNTIHVIVKGNNFKFFINGKPASEFTEHLPAERCLDKGMLQLQVHDPGMIVQFKDIRLKILK